MKEVKSMRFSEELIDEIEQQAEQENRNFSNMVKHCIKEYLNDG